MVMLYKRSSLRLTAKAGKYTEDQSCSEVRSVESAPIEKIEIKKEALDRKKLDLSLKASSYTTFKKIQVKSNDRSIDKEFDNNVVNTGAIEHKINDVNEIIKSEELNCSNESSFKLEIIKQEEVHIKEEEDIEDRVNEKKYNAEESKDDKFQVVGNKKEKSNKRVRKPGKQFMLHWCPECPYSTSRKGDLKLHSVMHKKEDEIDWYNCQLCPYKTYRKNNLSHHIGIHQSNEEKLNKKIHQCPECPYKTSRRRDLKVQAQIHNNLSLKCSKCSYETLRTNNLNKHMKTHFETNVQWLHCPQCSFKTRLSSSVLRNHVLAHKGDAFKCSKCPYQTGKNDRFTIHQVKHECMDKWHSCPLCSFKTQVKSSLKGHRQRLHGIIPKKPKQIKTFKCAECSFESGLENTYKRHQLIHDQNSWLRCSNCTYITPHRKLFKEHQLRHQGENGEGWYRCLECSYKTPHKQDLRKHIIIHKSADEIRWFQCSQCMFKTAYNNHLKRHQLKHKEAYDVDWFYCYHCSFKTKYKTDLRKHMLKHKKQSDKGLQK